MEIRIKTNAPEIYIHNQGGMARFVNKSTTSMLEAIKGKTLEVDISWLLPNAFKLLDGEKIDDIYVDEVIDDVRPFYKRCGDCGHAVPKEENVCGTCNCDDNFTSLEKSNTLVQAILTLADSLDKKGQYLLADELTKIIFASSEESYDHGTTEDCPTIGFAEESVTHEDDKPKKDEKPGVNSNTYRDPRIKEDADGTLRCEKCNSVIPPEEDQLGCRTCEEEVNLGFLKTPDGTLHAPRLKSPPRIYDRYREELPEDVEHQTGYQRHEEKKNRYEQEDSGEGQSPKKKHMEQEADGPFSFEDYPNSGGEPY